MQPYTHRVQYYETDKMGISHHSNYIRWMEEARVDYLDQIGWSYARLEEMGVISPVRAVECHYRATTTFSDLITIRAEIEDFNGVVLRLRYSMFNEAGTRVFDGCSEHCFLNSEGRILRLKRDYPDFYEALMALVPAKED